MLGHNSIENQYQTVFSMAQHHGYQLSDLWNLVPYELELFVNMVIQTLKEQEQRMRELNAGRK